MSSPDENKGKIWIDKHRDEMDKLYWTEAHFGGTRTIHWIEVPEGKLVWYNRDAMYGEEIVAITNRRMADDRQKMWDYVIKGGENV